MYLLNRVFSYWPGWAKHGTLYMLIAPIPVPEGREGITNKTTVCLHEGMPEFYRIIRGSVSSPNGDLRKSVKAAELDRSIQMIAIYESGYLTGLIPNA